MHAEKEKLERENRQLVLALEERRQEAVVQGTTSTLQCSSEQEWASTVAAARHAQAQEASADRDLASSEALHRFLVFGDFPRLQHPGTTVCHPIANPQLPI
eukprot:SAG31_NODE_1912_length_6935_cov_40.528525_3_plen_101_part_00